MSGPDQKEKKQGQGLTIGLFALTLAAVAGATFFLSMRLDALDEHIQNARIAAEEAESAAGAAAQNSANFRRSEAKVDDGVQESVACTWGAPDANGRCPEGPVEPAATPAKPKPKG